MQALVAELCKAGAREAIAVRMDLADRGSLTAAVQEVIARLGGVDVFVGNTGGPPSGPFLDIPPEVWKEALSETLLPLVDLSHAILPQMCANKWGRIIFVTTVGVKVVQPNMVLSDSLRLAVVGLAKSLSIEFAQHGILVNCLCPGPFATDRMEDLVKATMERDGRGREMAEKVWLEEVPLGKFGRPEDFGAMVAMLASERSGFTTGAAIALDGGKSRAY
jgi:3-oxoacyl-[acyl-carrier protein] reductase